MTRLSRCYYEKAGTAWKGKAMFGSKRDAMTIASRGSWFLSRTRMTAYRCYYCSHWHLTRKTK